MAFSMLPFATSTVLSVQSTANIHVQTSLQKKVVHSLRMRGSSSAHDSVVVERNENPKHAVTSSSVEPSSLPRAHFADKGIQDSMDVMNFSTVQLPHLQGNQSIWGVNKVESPLMVAQTSKLHVETRIFFLFMVRTGLVHEAHWEAFLLGTQRQHWHAFMHCVESGTCELNLAMRNPMQITQVPTVPSAYCSDLVSPMIQLLSYAVRESFSQSDKFVFVSETTLPVKPFSWVYSTLVGDWNSDICVAPNKEWKIMKNDADPTHSAKLVKHSQWIVLNQKHANWLVQRWSAATQSYMHWRVPIWPESEGVIARLPRNVGVCADEWLPMALIYGMISTRSGQRIHLPEFAPWGSLQLRGSDIKYHAQGNCHTWVGWGSRTDGTQAVGDAIMSHPGIQLECHLGCSGSHPRIIKSITDVGLHQFVSSPFLFARKFKAGSVSLDQFKRVVMSLSYANTT